MLEENTRGQGPPGQPAAAGSGRGGAGRRAGTVIARTGKPEVGGAGRGGAAWAWPGEAVVVASWVRSVDGVVGPQVVSVA